MELSGYPLEEAISMNCHALQGPDSDQSAVTRIRRALKAGTSIQGLQSQFNAITSRKHANQAFTNRTDDQLYESWQTVLGPSADGVFAR